jgi:hypothetical protein
MCPRLVASQLPQALLAVVRHVYLVDVVDVFPPQHMTYLRRDSVVNSSNTCIIIIVVVPILHPPPFSDLRTKSDLTIDAMDVVENIIGGAVLVVLEDSQHVSRL